MPAADRPRRRTASRTPGSSCTARRTGGAGRSRWRRSRRSTWRCGTSRPRSRACRSTSCSAAPPGPAHGLRARLGPRHCRSCSTRSASTSSWGSARSGCRPRCRASTPSTASPPNRAPTGKRYDYEPAQRTPLPAEEDWDTRAYLRHIPARVRGGPRRVRPRAAAAARRPPPADAHPGREARQGAGAVRPVLAGGLHPGREPGGAAAGAAAHHDARWPSARSSTPCGTTRRSSATSSSTTCARAVTHTGGITAMRKLLDYAAQYQIKSGIHGPTDISPVGHGRCAAPRTWRSTTSASRSTCGTAR